MRKLYAYLKTDENQDPKNPSAAIFSRILLHEEEELELSAEELEHLQRHPEVLIQFAASDVFRDELSPGYGKAPLNAIRAIEKAKINQADEVLFRLFATAVDEEEEILLSALASRGDVVLNRVVSILTSRPITPFHEKAALLLLQFLPDERVLVCAKQQLQEKDVGNSAAAKWLELAL